MIGFDLWREERTVQALGLFWGNLSRAAAPQARRAFFIIKRLSERLRTRDAKELFP
jgi:hypothetical protein